MMGAPKPFTLNLLRAALRKRKQQKPALGQPAPNTLDLTPVVERLDRMNATLERTHAGNSRPFMS